MARPPTIKDDDILRAAREVFLARGIKATTAEVAERAGVSEGTIFNRFKSKAELFRAALALQEDLPPFLGEALTRRINKGELRQHLTELAGEYLAFFRVLIPLVTMAWSNQGEGAAHEFVNRPDPPPLRSLKILAGYFEAEMRAGRLRRSDPEIVARSFIGAIWHHVWFEMMFQSHEVLPMPNEQFVRGFIQLLWQGLEPQQPAHKR